MIVQKGRSKFNGKPFTVVATGLEGESKNIKTGPVIQLTIIGTNRSPVEDNKKHKDGQSHIVCGTCPLAGGHGCYVQTYFSVQAIWKALKAKVYPKLDYSKFVGKVTRFGAYGEPVLIGLNKVKAIAKRAKFILGYTHAWSYKWAQPYKQFFLASVDNLKDKEECNKNGWKTFRIIRKAEEMVKDEVMCPNYTHGVQCITCGLCDARRKSKNIAVLAHGGAGVMYSINKRLDEVNNGINIDM